MTKPFRALFDDLKAGREVRATQTALYRLASDALLEPLRSKIPSKARGRLDAEDALHEAILRALKSIAQADCETERQFLGWVYSIARNLITDQARRMSADALPFARDSGPRGHSPAPRVSRIAGREKGPESAVARKEIIDNVLSQMREPDADVIRRRKLSGQSFSEIAAALQKTQKAVKGIYTRAWKRFQEIARKHAP